MLAASDKNVLLGMLPAMATIINAVPKEAYVNKEADTLLIMQRRLSESDLRMQLTQYNEIFSKQHGAGIPDITNSMIAYVRIKVLLESDIESFDGHAYRELYKECKNQIARTNNIIRLTKASAMTAEEYQKDRMDLILQKNYAFIASLENELASVEKKLERLPKVQEEATQVSIAPEKERVVSQAEIKKASVLDTIQKMLEARKDRKDIEKRLRQEEKKQAKTICEEIPFYDRKLVFTQSMLCRDIPVYSLMKRKNNIYFGLSKNVGKTFYDNEDQSLVELTVASEEFLQFMTADLLDEEYQLKPFSDEEKTGMHMYFDFMSRCFEQHIGVTLTVREYLNFKVYYNQLVSMMFDLEQQRMEDYYKALILADKYMGYMKCYVLECTDARADIIENLMKENSDAYVGDIRLILDNHIVDAGAREDLEKIIAEMEHFYEKEEIKELPAEVENQVEELPTMPMMYPNMYQGMLPNGLTQNIMQIVIQILDAKNEVVDEALYAGENIKQALYDYERKDAYIKRLGFRNNGVDVFYKEEVSK